jgi:hypothetical protein
VPRRTANQRAQDGCKCDDPRASHAFFPGTAHLRPMLNWLTS